MYENLMTEEQAILASRLQDSALGRQMKNPTPFGLDQSPQPVTPMGGATAELQMSLEVLSKVAEELRMRLAPVLRAGVENGSKTEGRPIDASSPLRSQLGSCSLRIGSIRNVLSDILDRLEV